MEKYSEVNELIQKFKQSFPAASQKATKIFVGLGFEDVNEFPYLWLEALADVTNSLFKSNAKEAEAHLKFMSTELNKGIENVTKAIDVAYVENLMLGFTNSEKKSAWEYFPSNIKQLYEAMWGRCF